MRFFHTCKFSTVFLSVSVCPIEQKVEFLPGDIAHGDLVTGRREDEGHGRILAGLPDSHALVGEGVGTEALVTDRRVLIDTDGGHGVRQQPEDVGGTGHRHREIQCRSGGGFEPDGTVGGDAGQAGGRAAERDGGDDGREGDDDELFHYRYDWNVVVFRL